MPGTLHVVATPIGNLEDISLRAIRVLKSVAVIAAEDTRRTRILLRHYDIATPCVSFQEHNERRRVPALIARLVAGDDVAVVTDAGTPSISDPGFQLVRAAREAGLRVEAVPGPSAVLTALVLSGLPTHEFTFLGFAPARSKDKTAWAKRAAREPRTVVFFDSPRRVRDTLARLAREVPDREIVIARELTKKFETVVKQPIIEAVSLLTSVPKGEITVVIGPAKYAIYPNSSCSAASEGPSDLGVLTEFERLSLQEGSSRRAAIRAVAQHFGIAPKAVYAAIERAKETSQA
jgi:16S rRNA (cytidine1402-2'-O)-methyltransferase